MQEYNPLTIANYFVRKGIDKAKLITPMELNKMVYYAHGWHLAFTGKPLISEAIQAWKYGPVIGSVYHSFKDFAGNGIDQLCFPSILIKSEYEQLRGDDNVTSLLDEVYDVYSEYNGVELSAMTHQIGTPWYRIFEQEGGKHRKGATIPNNLLRDFFIKKSQSKA